MYKNLLQKLTGYFIVAIFSLFIHPVACQTADTIDREDLVRGQRLFYGLVYLQNKSLNCESCHRMGQNNSSDTINWNPGAWEISEKYQLKTPGELSNSLLKPMGKRMAAAHHGFKFSPEEIVLLKAYMDEIIKTGTVKEKPVLTNLLLFIIACALFLLSATDLIITKKLKKRQLHYFILTVTSVFITFILVKYSLVLGRSPGYSPDQPVKFSHRIHAGQNQTDCVFCHSYAPVSKSAGIPPVNVCMNCHLLVRQGTRSGMFEIAKVTTAFEKMEPVRWIRVHNLPDHVYFNHAQHVTAGGINCTECHGEVKEMDRIVQVSDMSMGWCINCHRTRKVSFKENAFYSGYSIMAEKMNSGKIDSVTVSDQGGTECMRCHY